MEPEYLSNLYPDTREKNIVFYPGPHKYVINGDDSYISVTTFVHRGVEHFDADKIISRMMAAKKWPNNKYYGMKQHGSQLFGYTLHRKRS